MGTQAKPRGTAGELPWRIGIDTGGTFTDLVLLRPKGIMALKVPSTPKDPSLAVQTAFKQLCRGVPEAKARLGTEIIHGSTVATNTLLEGKGARVALITNSGFEDVIEIGRQSRRNLYSLQPTRPEPLVPRKLRFGIAERTLFDGTRLVLPGKQDLSELVRRVRGAAVDAIAVALLHSYANSDAERDIAEQLRPLDVPTCCSSDVVPRFREFERISTTVANAALLPVLKHYLERLRSRFRNRRICIQQSNGGWTSAKDAARFPIRMVLSGPAGGVRAAEVFLRAEQDVGVSFDMGGTSTDVGLIQGQASRVDQFEIDDRPLLVDSMEVHTIGAGGGSVLWVDDAGALRVGPHSAGASPGPACTGNGTLATITDAHCCLGRLAASRKLADSIVVSRQRSIEVLTPLAKRLGVTPARVAAAAIEIADAKMEQAIKKITLEKGSDPRQMCLFGYGGAAGLHLCRLTRRLGMNRGLIPPHPGAASALGMAISDARMDISQAWLGTLDQSSFPGVKKLAEKLGRKLRNQLLRELGPGPVTTESKLACRYAGQSYEISIPVTSRYARSFADEHRRRYGFQLENALECVAVHVSAVRKSPWQPPRAKHKSNRTPASSDNLRFWSAGKQRAGPLFLREDLKPGMRLVGPAIVWEATATTVVEQEFEAVVTQTGCLSLERRRRAKSKRGKRD